MDRRLSATATIYNYTLLAKRTVPPLFLAGYLFLLLIYTAWTVIRHGVPGVAACALSLGLVPIVQMLLTRLMIRWLPGYASVPWQWSLLLPWIGYLPSSFIRVKRFYFLQLQLVAVGLAWLGLAYVWLPGYGIGMMAFVHVWLLLPRLVLLWNLHSLEPHGMVKVSGRDISLYQT